MKVLTLIAIGVVLILVANVFYTVKEPEQVIITQFGKPVGDPISTPGLKAKMPFVQAVHRFDRRFLEWDGDRNQLPTKDKRFIWVDMYARWRITDPLLFFQRLRDERGAQTRLDDILDGETRNAIANHNLVELVRSSNREPETGDTLPEDQKTLDTIRFGREKIRKEILQHSQSRTTDLGIEILDVQFKRINYVEDVQKKVYERMIAERRRIADRFRSEGQGEASRILGEKERELKRVQSEAYKAAEEIRGRADAIATDTYAKAYGVSKEAESFYAFLKTLETYESTVDPETWMVLSTDGEFYRFLKTTGK